MTHLCRGAVVLALLAASFSQEDRLPFDVVCGENSIKVSWTILEERRPDRHFLGSCSPSSHSVIDTGETVVLFEYDLEDCKFKKSIKGKKKVYKNDLMYRPFAKPSSVVESYPVECVYKSTGWIPEFLVPGSGSTEGLGQLVFRMKVLNEELKGVARSNVFTLGSFIPIWAAVEQGSHQPLLLLMEECFAASTPTRLPDSPIFEIINNKGCLSRDLGKSQFLPRYHSSAIILNLEAVDFGLGENVYIHCKLVAWDPEVLDEGKKACHYVKERGFRIGSWKLLDDSSQSALCSCCEHGCTSRERRAVEQDVQGVVQQAILGPITIVGNAPTRK